ncbi:MAG: hypothetical protein Q8K92_06155 [Leadbetterella sp.]|nr:hypothetical protein [Leadbetterella sp.]
MSDVYKPQSIVIVGNTRSRNVLISKLQLLVHSSIKTTLRYIHVNKLTLESIKNPIDDLNIKNL